MKKLSGLLAGTVLVCALASWLAPRQVSLAAEPDRKTATLGVEGMTCGACSTSVRVVLKKLDGVVDAKVSLEEKKAVVTYSPAKVTPEKMVEAIQSKLPYKAKVLEPGKGK
jgi:copper chaperone CopZ